MRTVGQILKENREAKFYSLEEVEKAIKIRKELLLALESDDYAKLPPSTFVQGFIKNYATFLGLSSDKLLAVFRREFSDKEHQPHVMDTFAKPLRTSRIKLTPGRVLGAVAVVLILAFFVYLWLQYRQFVGSPRLLLTSPQDQLTTENPTIVVEGKTEPEMKVTVNGQAIELESDGSFKEEMALSLPVNKITVVTISKFGPKTQVERTVYLKR